MLQQSYLSNYDPSAFEAGTQWANQRQAARDALARQAQEQEAQKQRVEQEGEIRRRNEAAKLAAQFKHEAEVAAAAKNDPSQWRQKQLDAAIVNIHAAYNQALEDRADSGNIKEFDDHIAVLNKLETDISGMNPNEDIDTTKLRLPVPPVRVPGQAEIDEQRQSLAKEKLDEDYKRTSIANMRSEIGDRAFNNQIAARRLALKESNPASHLNDYQKGLMKAAVKGNGAYMTLLANVPRDKNGLILDNPTPDDYKNSGVNKLDMDKVRLDYDRSGGNFIQALQDPAVSEAMGIGGEARNYILAKAPDYGYFARPSLRHKFLADVEANKRHVPWTGGAEATQAVQLYDNVSHAFNFNAYTEPVNAEDDSQ